MPKRAKRPVDQYEISELVSSRRGMVPEVELVPGKEYDPFLEGRTTPEPQFGDEPIQHLLNSPSRHRPGRYSGL